MKLKEIIKLVEALNKTKLPEARETILDFMEIYHGNDFMNWIMGI